MNAYIATIQKLSTQNKYTNWYCSIIHNALYNRTINIDIFEKHHILPKSFKMGGYTDPDNIVHLTPKEHFISHLLLTKMFTGTLKQKMVYAYRGLLNAANKYQQYRYTSNLYSYFKIKIRPTKYTRVYFDRKVVYIHPDDSTRLVEYLHQGWDTIMPESYKIGRVGLRPKKASESAICNMKKSWKIRKTLSTFQQHAQTPEVRERISLKLRGRSKPVGFGQKLSASVKSQYMSGTRNQKGFNNTNYGRRKFIHSVTGEKKWSTVSELPSLYKMGWLEPNPSKYSNEL